MTPAEKDNAIRAQGRSEDCGVEIPEERRAAVPGCQMCADCQSLRELKIKQRGF